MPLHFLCTQRLQPPQKIALELPTPDWQTPQGYFPDFFSTSRFMPDSIIFVFPMFTRRPFFSISVFHVCTFTSSSSMDSALIIRSSAYSSSHGQPVRNSLDRASNTMMKSSGLRTEPWWTPTPTPNSSLYPSPYYTCINESLVLAKQTFRSHYDGTSVTPVMEQMYTVTSGSVHGVGGGGVCSRELPPPLPHGVTPSPTSGSYPLPGMVGGSYRCVPWGHLSWRN